LFEGFIKTSIRGKMKYEMNFLKRAVEIAGKGISKGCGPFGAIIVRNGEIISEANNRVVLSHDPTAHAEILAIRKASGILGSHDLSECILYSSCEPCPMCLGAVYWAGIKKIVYASDRHEAEASGFSDNLIYNEINLDPPDRIIEFIHVPDAGGKNVFRIWDETENKVHY
jgi:tRNA(Arg) A34 adenosine deaminase TadA